MKERVRKENYDPIYGKVMGMSNDGYTAEHIANVLSIPVYRVWEIRQIAYGRSLMYGRQDRP